MRSPTRQDPVRRAPEPAPSCMASTTPPGRPPPTRRPVPAQAPPRSSSSMTTKSSGRLDQPLAGDGDTRGDLAGEFVVTLGEGSPRSSPPNPPLTTRTASRHTPDPGMGPQARRPAPAGEPNQPIPAAHQAEACDLGRCARLAGCGPTSGTRRIGPPADADRPPCSGATRAHRVRSASAGRPQERHRSEAGHGGLRGRVRMVTMCPLVGAVVAGPGFEPG